MYKYIQLFCGTNIKADISFWDICIQDDRNIIVADPLVSWSKNIQMLPFPSGIFASRTKMWPSIVITLLLILAIRLPTKTLPKDGNISCDICPLDRNIARESQILTANICFWDIWDNIWKWNIHSWGSSIATNHPRKRPVHYVAFKQRVKEVRKKHNWPIYCFLLVQIENIHLWPNMYQKWIWEQRPIIQVSYFSRTLRTMSVEKFCVMWRNFRCGDILDVEIS